MKYNRTNTDRKPGKFEYIGDDGLIYCRLCGNALEHLNEYGNLEESYDKRHYNCIEYKRDIEAIRSKTFNDRRSANTTFELDDDPDSEVSKLSRNYAQMFSEKSTGLLFYGGCGSGKTFLAACIANAIIDRGFTVKFTSISEIERNLWGAKDKNEVFYDMRNYDMIVIDDFSAERKTEYMDAICYDVIDWLYRIEKPVIVTTNLSPSDFKTSDIAQARLFSRLLEMALPVKVNAKDRRQSKLKTNGSAEYDRLINGTASEESWNVIKQRADRNAHHSNVKSNEEFFF